MRLGKWPPGPLKGSQVAQLLMQLDRRHWNGMLKWFRPVCTQHIKHRTCWLCEGTVKSELVCVCDIPNARDSRFHSNSVGLLSHLE